MDDYQKQYLEAEKNMDENKELKGLGGWLILVGTVLIFSFLRTGTQLLNTYSLFSRVWTEITNKALETYQPMLAPTLIFEIIANIVLFLLLIVLIINYFMKKKLFPKLIISMYIYHIIIAVINIILVLQLNSPAINLSMVAIVQNLLASCIWIPYHIKSKRVKNTFVN